jgi:DNA-binding NtrC family response regulator
MVAFRANVEQLNQYAHKHKGSISCVLLTGPTGVGKTFSARALSAHSQWLRLGDDARKKYFTDPRNKSFAFPATQLIEEVLGSPSLSDRGVVRRLATVHGPQLGDELAGSELFGHVKGAFTGAETTHPGIFGDKAVEDILLDEIADLSLRVQAKLLEFIESRTFRPVGGTSAHEDKSDHRLLLATNRPLERLVKQGRFREDFYWRIQGHRIALPPLRERKDVIRDLSYSILNSINHRHRGEQKISPSSDPERDKYCLTPKGQWRGSQPQKSNWVTTLTEEDLRWCESYDWPGNIRELKQRLDLYVYHDGHERLCDLLPTDFQPVGDDDGVQDEQSVLDDLVTRYLQHVLDGTEPPPGRPNDLLRRYEQMIKQAVYKFKASRCIGPSDLGRIFPGAKDPDTTIGRWKP